MRYRALTFCVCSTLPRCSKLIESLRNYSNRSKNTYTLFTCLGQRILQLFNRFLDDFCIIFQLAQPLEKRGKKKIQVTCDMWHVTRDTEHVTRNRIVRPCTDPENREKLFSEQKRLLLGKEYVERVVDSATTKARLVPKGAALRKANEKTKEKQGLVLAVTFDQRLPPFKQNTGDQWQKFGTPPKKK